MRYLFYTTDSDRELETELPLDIPYSFEVWKPSLRSIAPRGMRWERFAAWWVMHYLHMFTNHDYSMLIIHQAGTVVHRSVVFPRYFRFPFMAKDDLQIGDIWTMPEHRGKGFATFAIQKITELNRKPDRKFWYIVEENNIPSIRVIEKAGFARIGEGVRNMRLGLGLLGSYVIQERYC